MNKTSITSNHFTRDILEHAQFCYFVNVEKTHLYFLAILIFNLNLIKLIQIKKVTIINFLSY